MSEKISDGYVPEPFPEHELEPYGWHDILATLDVCANVHTMYTVMKRVMTYAH